MNGQPVTSALNLRLALATVVLSAVAATFSPAATAQETSVALSQRLAALQSNPEFSGLAAYEQLQARQALAVLAEADGDDRAGARYVAERRVRIAETVARTQAMQREIDQLERQRSELIVAASQREAAQARAEAERLRTQAQIQAEEAARLRRAAMADAAIMQDVEAALEGVAGAQTAKLSAARERQAALARQEAALMAGGTLPPSTRDDRGEVFTLAGDAFASGQASLTAAAAAQVRTLAAYIQAGPGTGSIRIEGHTDNQGDAEANLELSGQRAAAVRDVLVGAGVDAAGIQVVGRGQSEPLGDNATAAGRARNRRVEIILGP